MWMLALATAVGAGGGPLDALVARGARVTPLGDTFFECRMHSPLLGREFPFTLHLPPGYPEGRPGGWPLILFLHGAGRDHRTLLNDPVTRAAFKACPCVVLLPNGGASWWIDSEAVPASRYQSYLLELLDAVSPPLRVSEDPAHCAAGGWSMGGFGSANLVADHPERFSAWGGLIALLDFPNDAYPPEQNHSVPPVLGAKGSREKHNPLAKAERFRGKRICFLTAEKAFERAMNDAFHQRLDALGIGHEYAVVEGGHTWPTVAATFPRILAFLTESVTAPASRASWTQSRRPSSTCSAHRRSRG